MKLERFHWRHYFGGVAFLLMIIQLTSGGVLAFFYSPHLNDAYPSIQYLYNHFTFGAWVRDTHRWIALFLFIAILVHTVRSLIRMEFINPVRKIYWLTGFLLLLPLLGFIVTGIVLPWEWKGYWFMEMVPNYAGSIPFIGTGLKGILIQAFTLSRNLVIHIFILPLISIILVDLHFLTKMRRRGVFRYLLKHGLIGLPIFVAIFLLAMYLPLPSQDPEIIPFPLDGMYIPAPEWIFVTLTLPFMYFKGFLAPLLSIYLPLILFLALTFLPFFFNSRQAKEKNRRFRSSPPAEGSQRSRFSFLNGKILQKGLTFVTVLLVVITLLGLFYWGSYKSPTMGCSSCHNLYSGIRMGKPPEAFKDRNVLPLLDDKEWMVRHWFYPQVVW